MKKTAIFPLIGFAFLAMIALSSCKKDPSVLKVYVRSESEQLLPGIRVIIAGDIEKAPTREYQDTVMTNSSGYAVFDMDKYFGDKPEKAEVGYFDIIAKSDDKTATLYDARVRVNITNVESLKLKD